MENGVGWLQAQLLKPDCVLLSLLNSSPNYEGPMKGTHLILLIFKQIA